MFFMFTFRLQKINFVNILMITNVSQHKILQGSGPYDQLLLVVLG